MLYLLTTSPSLYEDMKIAFEEGIMEGKNMRIQKKKLGNYEAVLEYMADKQD